MATLRPSPAVPAPDRLATQQPTAFSRPTDRSMRGPEPTAASGVGEGYLIYQVMVGGAEPCLMAAERDVSRPALVEQLPDAVGALAIRYERLANGDLNDWPAVSLRAALGGKRS